jgi:hypothetical protein
MKEFITTPCPYCGIRPDGHRDGRLSDVQPSPGDGSMCVHCKGLSIFGADLARRKPTADELAEMMRDAPLQLEVMSLNIDEYRRTGRRPWMPGEWGE